MNRILPIANGMAFVATIFMNYFSNTGYFGGKTIGSVSDELTTLFTPASYAFSIWVIIYLLLLGFVFYQGWGMFKRQPDPECVSKIGWWFVISCVANSLWILAWIYEFIGWSVVIMLVLLVSLIRIVLANRMELWDAPVKVILFLWWPFVIYSGWITVATVANVSAYLHWIQWSGWGISESTWTLMLIGVAGLINLVVTWKRNMREFALVGAWALIAIAVANWETDLSIRHTAIGVAALLLASSATHALLNWQTNPVMKILDKRK